MTHTPEMFMMLDDFNTMINVEELEPIDYEEREMLMMSIFEDDVYFDDDDDYETW